MPANDPAAEAQQALSQSEVEQLLAQVAGDPVPPAGEAAAVPAHTLHAQPYDFRGSSLLTTGELRRARMRHEEFVRSLATRLSIYLRLEFGARLSALQTLPHARFLDRLASPVHITLFRVEPLNGLAFLAMPPQFCLGLVDRLLGGPGAAPKLERDLSEIEIALMDLIAHVALKEWCREVAGQTEGRIEILGHETNARFLPAAPSDAHLLALGMEWRVGESAEEIQLGFPLPMLEPIIRQGDSVQQQQRALNAPAGLTALPWNPQLSDIRVPLSAEWHGLEITVDQFAHLRVGDVLPVAAQHFDHVRVRLARIPKFVARLGVAHNTRAVELLETLRT